MLVIKYDVLVHISGKRHFIGRIVMKYQISCRRLCFYVCVCVWVCVCVCVCVFVCVSVCVWVIDGTHRLHMTVRCIPTGSCTCSRHFGRRSRRWHTGLNCIRRFLQGNRLLNKSSLLMTVGRCGPSNVLFKIGDERLSWNFRTSERRQNVRTSSQF